MSERYRCYLRAPCVNEEYGKCISVPFDFKNEELWEMHCDSMFDDLYQSFNEWLWEHGREGWVLDDTVETEREAREGEEMENPVIVDE